MTTLDTNRLIKVKDIRKGDHIRKHYLGGPAPVHVDYVASLDGHLFASQVQDAVWELIDRPEVFVQVAQSAIDDLADAHHASDGRCAYVEKFLQHVDEANA